MITIKTITVDGNVYDIEDSDARESIETLNGTGDGSVDKKISTALGTLTYLSKEIATQDEINAYIADPTSAKFNVIYLLKDTSSTGADKYLEYQRLGTEDSSTFEMTGDTSTDLSNYVEKEDGKGLSTNDYTTADKTEVAKVANKADKADVPSLVIDDTITSTTKTWSSNKINSEVEEINSNIASLQYSDYGVKNLFNPSNILKGSFSNDTYKLTTSDRGEIFHIDWKPNTQYTFSGYAKNVYSSTSSKIHLKIMYTDGTSGTAFYNETSTEEYLTFTSSANKTIYYVIRDYGTAYDGNYFTIRNLQIEEGTTATDYEPYIMSNLQLTELKANIDSEQNEGVAYPTINGMTNYEDSNGVYHKNLGWIDLGTLSWEYQSGYTYSRFQTKSLASLIKKGTTNIKCAIYVVSDTGTVDNSMFSYSDGRFFVYDSSYSDASSFTTAMSGVMLFYELATPQTWNSKSVIEEIKDDLANNLETRENVATSFSASAGARKNKQVILNIAGTMFELNTGWNTIGTVSLSKNYPIKDIGFSATLYTGDASAIISRMGKITTDGEIQIYHDASAYLYLQCSVSYFVN